MDREPQAKSSGRRARRWVQSLLAKKKKKKSRKEAQRSKEWGRSAGLVGGPARSRAYKVPVREKLSSEAKLLGHRLAS